MATKTLLQLRDAAKSESDNVGSTFVTDAEWNVFINASYGELYGLVTGAFGNDYFVQTPATGFLITTTGITSFFALPTDFFKMLGVDLQVNGANWTSLKPFNFSERNRYSTGSTQFPMAGQVVRLFYVPLPTALVADADTIDGVNSWEEYIVIDAALKAMAKEESDISALAMRKQAILTRLEAETENRDAGSPMTVSDVAGKRQGGMAYRINGNQLWLIGNGTPWDVYGGFEGGW